MNDSCQETITLDLQKCAVDALTKAIGDYVKLCGQEEPFVKAFLSWTWHNKDGFKIMEMFKGMPEKLERKRK